MTHESPVKCDDETTWNHRDEQIDLPMLISLVEAHGGTEGLDLHGCKITGIDLSYAALQPYLLHRSGTNLPPWVYGIWGVKLQGAHLEHAEIITSNLRGADLSTAHLEHAGFVSCVLDEVAIVRAQAQRMMIVFGSAHGATFNNSDLRNATLSTDLTGASFGGANMRDATLLDATLDTVDLRLTDLTGAMLSGAKFNRTRIRPSNVKWSIGEELVARGKKQYHRRITYVEAADVYRDLKANLVSLGYYDEASWAYVKQKQMEKMAYRGYWRRNWPLTWLSPLNYIRVSTLKKRQLRRWLRLWVTNRSVRAALRKWIASWLFEALTGYGERAVLPLVWALSLVLIPFPLIYWATGALSGHRGMFASSSLSDIDWSGWTDSVVYSLTTFGTLSFNRLQPEGNIASVVSALEAYTGVLLFALFIFTLGNRMSRS